MIHTATYTAWKWQCRWNEKDVCRWNFGTSKIHTAAVSVHGGQLFLLISAKHNAFYAKCF